MVINVEKIDDICPKEYVKGMEEAFADIWEMENAPGKANKGRELVQQSVGLSFGQGWGPSFFETQARL